MWKLFILQRFIRWEADSAAGQCLVSRGPSLLQTMSPDSGEDSGLLSAGCHCMCSSPSRFVSMSVCLGSSLSFKKQLLVRTVPGVGIYFSSVHWMRSQLEGRKPTTVQVIKIN